MAGPGQAPGGGSTNGDGASTPSGRSTPSGGAAGLSGEPDSRGRRGQAGDSAWRQMSRFFELGVEHIFLGYDHILFLLSLLLASRFREIIKIVTSFTVAHTITLMLATLHVVRLPPVWLVESAIAATIVYVAIENFWVRESAHRWKLTFFCGLVHGFGFAEVLRELGLPTEGLVRSLVAFNCGVEVGQLIIVAAIFPLVMLLARWRYGKQARLAISAAIALCGAGWLVDRVFGLNFMPF
jgi:hydrogenase/urease accessory protein HupE